MMLGSILIIAIVVYSIWYEHKPGGCFSKNPKKYKDDGYEGSRGACGWSGGDGGGDGGGA